MTFAASRPLSSVRAGPLRGRVRMPGDVATSHHALILGALATGITRITGLRETQDVLCTARAVMALGATVRKVGDTCEVLGRGVGGLAEPAAALDLGTSGTAVRLILGAIAGHDMTVTLTGEASLSRLSLAEVLAPLRRMGLEVIEPLGRKAAGPGLPLTVRGAARLVPVSCELPVPSADATRAILIAGLAAPGETTVTGGQTSHDHTARMLRQFGADVRLAEWRDGGRAITVVGDAELAGCAIRVPGDFSAAAMITAAALIVPGSEVLIEAMRVREPHSGFSTIVTEMGGDVTLLNVREEGGEPIADIRVRASHLSGVRVPPECAPSLIDDYPLLAAVAACARGTTRIEGLAGLCADGGRPAALAAALVANGVRAGVEGDALIVHGMGGAVPGGGTVATHMDHRIAMALLTLGLAADRPVTVDDTAGMSTCIGEFRDLLQGLGAHVSG